MTSTAYNISDADISLLERRIAKFITLWGKCSTYFPKIHYMIHIPSAIRKFGPPIKYSCFRFESLHQIFKRYAKNCGFKNVGMTVATKFQKLMAIRSYDHSVEIDVMDNGFIKNNIFFKCGDKNIVVFKQNGSVKFGSLLRFTCEKASIKIFKSVIFNSDLLYWEIIDESTETVEVLIKDLFDYIGHSYEYGPENDRKKVIMFKYIIS